MEALEKVKNSCICEDYSYAIIFMDCNMPIMDGYQSSEKIKNYQKINNQELSYIVACTGHTENEYIKKAWNY